MSDSDDNPILPTVPYQGNDVVVNAVAENDKAGRLVARSRIERLHAAMEEYFGSERGEVNEINANGLTEQILDGMYMRQLFIPAGVAIVSKLWKRDRWWIILQGDVTFTSELGTQRVRGPHTQVAPYGSKIALYAHTDTLWFAIARTDAERIEDAEQDVEAPGHESLRYPWDEFMEEQ